VELHRWRRVAGDRARDGVVDAGGTSEVLIRAAHAARREVEREVDRLAHFVEGLVEG